MCSGEGDVDPAALEDGQAYRDGAWWVRERGGGDAGTGKGGRRVGRELVKHQRKGVLLYVCICV